jgi:hypothetical protein
MAVYKITGEYPQSRFSAPKQVQAQPQVSSSGDNQDRTAFEKEK